MVITNGHVLSLVSVHAGFFIHHSIVYFIVTLLTCVSLLPMIT